MDAALVILDGWGLGPANPWPDRPSDGMTPPERRDAVLAADTPAFDRYTRAGATGRLRTWGRSVGLPDGQTGNSEVGHLTIGAGRVVRQAYTRIEDAIAADRVTDRPAIADAFRHASETGARLHVLGLLSDGGVHADHRHLHALVRAGARADLETVTHPFTDGRDTSPTAGAGFLEELERVADDAGTGHPATVMGRYFAMDRDENWDRTRAAYDAIVDRRAVHRAPDGPTAVEAAYERGETDEFIEPTLVADRPPIRDGDAVLMANFRADRVRQLTRMLAGIEPVWPGAIDPPETYLATMTEYDEEYEFPVAFPPRTPERTLGAIVADAGRTQLRIAESEKYAHVTYFLNGGRETVFAGEQREIVSSPDVSTYDLQPEMHASRVTTRALDRVGAEDPDLLVLNYANPDMVGHTGDFDATIAAVEAVDGELHRLVPALRAAGSHVVITADHGNADDLGTPEDPHTAHTDNPVPIVYLSPDGDLETRRGASAGRVVAGDPGPDVGLSTLAPALLGLMGVDPAPDMTDISLFLTP